jgi:branched-chain amino acid transport system permease protein
MTATATITKSAFDVETKDIGRAGSLLALGLVFTALAGLPVGLDNRAVISGLLSLGYLALIWMPILAGWNVAKDVVLEGVAATEKGANDVVTGALAGALGGAGLAALMLLVDRFDLRDPLVNWSPQLVEFLTFGQGRGFGFVAWPVICGALGAMGAGLHLLSDQHRRIVTTVVGAVLFFAIFESFIVDLLDFAEKPLYAPRGGLEWYSALVIGVLAAAYAMSGAKEQISTIKTAYADSTGQEKSRQTAILIGLSLVALIVVPMITGKITQELMANVGIFLLLALGLNIVVGLAGILDLGYVAFFAVGGYTTAVLTSQNRGPNWPSWFPHTNWVVALLVSVVIAGLVGLFIGAPVIRMRGDYLAIVTLGFGEIIRILFLSDWLKGYFNGAQGITNVPAADFGLFEVAGTNPRSVFYLVLFFAVLSIYASWRLERSRLGRAWMAIREDETVAEAMGINTVNAKLKAFVVGAVLASFSGAIFSAKVGSIFPTSFLILVSIIILVVVIVGGMGNIMGVIVGAVVLIGVLGGPKQPGLLQEFSEYKLLIYGALLIWMMLKRPEGLVPNARRSRELHQDEFLQDAWLKGEVDDDDDDPTPAGGQVASA